MKQIVISGGRTEGVAVFAAASAELDEAEIHKIILRKYLEFKILHKIYYPLYDFLY